MKVASRSGLPRRVEDARFQRDTPPVVRMRASPDSLRQQMIEHDALWQRIVGQAGIKPE